MAIALARWNIDEYHQMIATGLLEERHLELLQGDIVEMPPEGPEHAYLGTRTDKYLTRLLGDRAEVRQSHPITLSDHSEPEPDIAIVRPLGGEYRYRHPNAEEVFWLIEYANTSLAKDTDIKRKIYAENGIPEYWIADLQQHRLLIFRNPQSQELTAKSSGL